MWREREEEREGGGFEDVVRLDIGDMVVACT